MNDTNSPDLTHIDFDEQGTEFLDEAFENGERRTLSGIDNNKNNPEFGAADQPFIRITENAFGDGVSTPRGVENGVQTLPNEREISNVIAKQDDDGDGIQDKTFSVHDTNLYMMAFGQFFDHGLDFLQRSSDPDEKYVIDLDPSDPLYDAERGITSITLTRGEEAINPATGEAYVPRAHINKTSPFIDQNQTYGSSDAVNYYLRLSATDENGDILRNPDGTIVKLAGLKSGDLDASGFYNLPKYSDILLNNGVEQATIDAAIAQNDFSILEDDPNFVDFRDVKDPFSGNPDGNPLLLDVAFDANPDLPNFFQVENLLDHYVAGDGRVNENISLTPIHTIFHRDHEHWVETLREMDGVEGNWSEDKIFESAKLIVGAEYQRIIFDEFIDALAGSLPGPTPHGFDGYHPRVDAQISEEFAHAVYRVGHSMITETIPFTTADGSIEEMSLVEAFLNPGRFEEVGVDALIGGTTSVAHERIDENIVDAVRDQLLGQASDLAAINIARGREVGVKSLNELRRELYEQGSKEAVNGSDVTRALQGNEELRPYDDWDDFASHLRDPSLVELFKEVYDSVDDVDLWIGGLAEKPRHPEEGQMGSTFTWVFWEQMDRLQDGDAFYYKGFFSDTEILGMLETQTFADIIMRNSGEEFLNDSIFNLTEKVELADTDESFVGTDANETIVGNDLDNEINAGGGNDTVYGQDGNDLINGEGGDDALRGEAGDDELHGGDGEDRIVGGDGDDLIFGEGDQDALNGNDGNDEIHGGSEHDEVHGNNGDDILFGGEGGDVVKGGLGNDTIDGGEGDDSIETNGGNDVVITGEGKDVVLMSDDQGDVTISDFNINEDRIDLRLFDVRNQEDLEDTLTVVQDGDDTLLSIADSTIRLTGIDEGDFDHDNIKFDNDVRNLVINGRMDEKIIEVNDGEISLREFDEGGTENEHSVAWKNWEGGTVGYASEKANRVLEVGTNDYNGEIYQELPTEDGQVYQLSFDSARTDTSNGEEAEFEVLWNGEVVGDIEPGEEWSVTEIYVEGTGGLDRLSFRGNGDYEHDKGAMIDNVIVRPSDGTEPVPPTEIVGTEGNDYLHGTLGSDDIKALGGNDVIVGTKGNDNIDGGGSEYDQVDYSGHSGDYTFTANSDGSITVTHPENGTDTLTNIDGFWFTEEGEWYPLEDVVDLTSGDIAGKTIEGTDGDDYLHGTIGNDTIDAKAGRDVVTGSRGNDSIDGGGSEYDQVDYSGSSTDYTFTANDDGTVTVTHATNGTDTLKSVDGFWFSGENQWYSLEDLIGEQPGGGPGEDIEGTDGRDYLHGTRGNDTIDAKGGKDVIVGSRGDDIIDGGGSEYDQVDYEGAAVDYQFTANVDGSVTVAHESNGTDLLKNIDGFWFSGEGQWYAAHQLIDFVPTDIEGEVITGTNGRDYLAGTVGNDEIDGLRGRDVIKSSLGNDIIDGGGSEYDQVDYKGGKADYEFVKDDVNKFTVTSDVYGVDTLIDIDGIWFEGDAEWHDIDDLA